jgi:DNA processing protein
VSAGKHGPRPWNPPSDDHVAAVALAGIEEMTPLRMQQLLDRYRSASAALTAVQRGDGARWLLSRMRASDRVGSEARLVTWARRVDPDRTRHLLLDRRGRVWLRDEPGYPILEPVPEPPPLLVAEGDRPDAFDAPRVAIVGTRAATPHGLADARELGATLSSAGITVISGLAIGIDGAAHQGALDGGGPTIGVVATGLDIEYPRRHVGLYRRVREQGLVLGETGYGIRPAPGRFPVRNRIIAALADVVVVVEATLTGGARITAEHALRYDRPVLAVPGSRRNAAAAGTNALIADGAHPLTEWSDLVLALDMTPGSRRCAPMRPAPDAHGRAVLDALGGDAGAPEALVARTGLSPEELALAVRALERDGWARWSSGLVWPT